MESNYTSLMTKRVKRILLVCNNYDSFALEEDGRIDVQIAQEYAELNCPTRLLSRVRRRPKRRCRSSKNGSQPRNWTLTSSSPCTARVSWMCSILRKRQKP